MKKYVSEYSFYFLIFVALSLFYIVYGYAALGTNDDWALQNLLLAKGVYGTLIMSYPLSYLVSHLYDLFPSVQWYSLLLSSILLINFYFISLYIAQGRTVIIKLILLLLALLIMTYLWFNMTITAMTVLTILSALGFANRSIYVSLILLFVASLLRSEILFIFIPFFAVAFLIIREKLFFTKGEIVAFVILILLIAGNIYIQKQDKAYIEWLSFNKARSSVADLHSYDRNHTLNDQEHIILNGGWVQDEQILPAHKIIKISPSLKDTILFRWKSTSIKYFFAQYKFHYWIWLLVCASLIAIILNFRNRRVILIPAFVMGTFLLLIIRDVERVTVLLITMWAFLLYDSLREYKYVNILFIALFTALFYYYSSGQLGYRYYKENMALQEEARTLIHKSGIVCEPSINFPTRWTSKVTTLFQANYLFREKRWPKLNQTEILPAGWLSRHPYFYTTHRISHGTKKRKFQNYHDFLLDKYTGFIGGKMITNNKKSKILLDLYDTLYLKKSPECKHRARIVSMSPHYAISQIVIECNATALHSKNLDIISPNN